MLRVGATKVVVIIVFMLMMAGGVYAQSVPMTQHQPPSFNEPLREESHSGHIKIIWEDSGVNPDGVDFQLQQSQDPTFATSKTLYQGDDLGTFLSGLPNGEYYFRLRKVDERSAEPLSGWSAPLWLTVEHHPLSLALWLFVLGAVVFALTVFVLLKGVRDTKEDDG